MKKFIFVALISLATVLGVSTLLTVNNNVFPSLSEVNGYTLTLNSNNSDFIPSNRSSGISSSANSPKTVKRNIIVFSYKK